MRITATLLTLCLLLVMSSSISASQIPKEIDEFGGLQCEDEMARLDNYAIEFNRVPKAVAYVIAYGGRRGTAHRELRVRMARIERYLINHRGLDSKRVVIVPGGFRESLTIELWLVAEGQEMPKSAPTVSPREVRYKRGRFIVDCSLYY